MAVWCALRVAGLVLDPASGHAVPSHDAMQIDTQLWRQGGRGDTMRLTVGKRLLEPELFNNKMQKLKPSRKRSKFTVRKHESGLFTLLHCND